MSVQKKECYISLAPIAANYKFKKRLQIFFKEFLLDKGSEKYQILYGILMRNKILYIDNGPLKELNIYLALNIVIPDVYFGCKENRKRFYKTVKKVINRSRNECIYFNELFEGYNYEKIPWLNSKNKSIELGKTNQWLLNYIVKAIISDNFYSMRDIHTTYGLILVPKRKWFRFQSRVINYMIKKGHLVPISGTTHSVRGNLRIIMKDGIENFKKYRPIIISKTRIPQLKYLSKEIRMVASTLSTTKIGSFFQHWSDNSKKFQNQKIYTAKVDIKDAFGWIDINNLTNLLGSLHKRGGNKLTKTNIEFLINYVQNQRVIFKKRKNGTPCVGKWNHGLLQGDPLSPAFCHLYMSELDRLYLKGFSKDALIHRTVDDYLFCSVDREEAKRFIEIMKSDYQMNNDKIQDNIDNENSVITYCGNLIILDTKEIKYNFTFQKGTFVKNRCKLWNLKMQIPQNKPENFILRALTFGFNNYYFRKMYINNTYNSKLTSLDNFFEGMIYIAFKFDAAVVAVYKRNMDKDFFLKIIKKTIYEYSNRASNTITKNTSSNDEEHQLDWNKYFSKIGIQAFILVLQKRNLLYESVIKELKKIYKFSKRLDLNLKRYKKLPNAFRDLRLCSCSSKYI